MIFTEKAFDLPPFLTVLGSVCSFAQAAASVECF
nr:MAG TPA: hypothetical protein [Caudoviricetes sp.]